MELTNEQMSQIISASTSAMFLAILGAGVKFIGDIARSVRILNEKMVAVVTKVEMHGDAIDDMEKRTRKLEIRGGKGTARDEAN